MTMKTMKTIFKLTSATLLLCLFPTLLGAQEILTGFQHPDNAARQQGARQTLTLPFYDDFSSTERFPDSQKWADIAAYINSGFPLNPVTRNAATLDVLDANGVVYDYAISNPFTMFLFILNGWSKRSFCICCAENKVSVKCHGLALSPLSSYVRYPDHHNLEIAL